MTHHFLVSPHSHWIIYLISNSQKFFEFSFFFFALKFISFRKVRGHIYIYSMFSFCLNYSQMNERWVLKLFPKNLFLLYKLQWYATICTNVYKQYTYPNILSNVIIVALSSLSYINVDAHSLSVKARVCPSLPSLYQSIKSED